MQLLEVLWIPILRFRIIPRIWAIALICVNCAAILFIESTYAQIAILAGGSGAIAMMIIYANLGFVRLLGIGHIFWIPMLCYFTLNMPDRYADPELVTWVSVLVAFNSISLFIDAVDLLRYWRGERQPYYHWWPQGPHAGLY